jgi:hypothetical protein
MPAEFIEDHISALTAEAAGITGHAIDSMAYWKFDDIVIKLKTLLILELLENFFNDNFHQLTPLLAVKGIFEGSGFIGAAEP